MNEYEKHCSALKLRQDFEAYLHGHHTASDTLLALAPREMYELLMALLKSAPNSMSKQLALLHPLSAEQYDHVEGVIQDMIPGFRGRLV